MKYIELSNQEQLEDLHNRSFNLSEGLLIFKHSRRCAISSMAYSRFSNNWDYVEEKFPIYYLDVIKNRNISNEVASKYGIRHESPQVLLIKDGVCTYSASHMEIHPGNLSEVLND